MIDAHCHLTVYGDKIERAIKDIEDTNMVVIAVSSDFATFHETESCIHESDCIIPSFGIHPKVAPHHKNRLDEIYQEVVSAGVIGEIGLDNKGAFDESILNAQKKVFESILEAACEYDKTVNVHCAGAEREVLSILETYNPAGVILHGYEGPVESLSRVIDNDFMISIGRGILQEFKDRNPLWKRTREIAEHTPYDLLLVESDIPVVNPLTMPSELISELIEELSIIRKETAIEITAQTKRNLRQVLSSTAGMQKYCEKLRIVKSE
ncbi:hypothetical protein EU537_07815 [Candidatus Thorarchaeota archaeon]|nr:MAG: hypothetical protein EU537_07815 [Candidatus Thorarchaeota archaeon]